MEQDNYQRQSSGACQACNAGELLKVLDLGLQPLCNEFVRVEESNQPQTYYPLCLCYCNSCSLVQLDYVMPTGITFGSQYTYLTGSSPSLQRYYSALANNLYQQFALQPGDAVVEIGSNDGTFLKEFKNLGIDSIGIDGATQSSTRARRDGLKVIEEFFGKGSAVDINQQLDKGSDISLVLAMNVLAHTDNLGEFLDEVKTVMNDGSVFITSCHWLSELIRNFEFDTIYHEHLRYYTLTSLAGILEKHGLFVFDAEITDFYGGSILTYAKTSRGKPTDRLKQIMEEENGLDIVKSLTDMKNTLITNKARLLTLLTDLRSCGHKIIGVGAPMKASTLLNFYGITSDLLDYIAEVNELKIGTLVPGVRIPVVDEKIVFEDQPDYALLLSWNMSGNIIENYRSMGFKGKFIIPVPTPEVVNE